MDPMDTDIKGLKEVIEDEDLRSIITDATARVREQVESHTTVLGKNVVWADLPSTITVTSDFLKQIDNGTLQLIVHTEVLKDIKNNFMVQDKYKVDAKLYRKDRKCYIIVTYKCQINPTDLEKAKRYMVENILATDDDMKKFIAVEDEVDTATAEIKLPEAKKPLP